MANQLTMADIQAILTLHQRGWRIRRIARELNVDRETVAKYIRASACVPKPAKAPIGPAATGELATKGPEGRLPAPVSHEERGLVASPSSFLSEAAAGDSKPAKAPLGSVPSELAKAPIGCDALAAPDPTPASSEPAGPTETSAGSISLEKESGRSACEPYRQVILKKLEQGLSAQRIYQDLVPDGFGHEYHSVRRFVAKLQKTSPLPFRRMESAAGEEAQIDFGTGAWIELPGGKRRRSHVFRIVLSYSRKGLLRSRLPPDDRGLHSMHRERVLAFRRRAQDSGDRQSQGGGHSARLVRPRIESQDPVVLRTLRLRDLAHEACARRGTRERSKAGSIMSKRMA